MNTPRVELADPAGCDVNEISLVVGGGSWGSEVSWDLSDGSSGGVGSFDLCLADGDYISFDGIRHRPVFLERCAIRP